MKFIAVSLLCALSVSASPVSKDASPASLTTAPSKPAPTDGSYNWSEGWKANFPIHQSCNSTLKRQLSDALAEAVEVAQHARNHLLRFGDKSELKKKYFGNASTAAAVGWYDRITAADKSPMLFRCDDPDRNCATQNSESLSILSLH